MPFYYTATVIYPDAPKQILISSGDYDRITVGDQLQLLYNVTLDDIVAADYTAGHGHIAFVLMLWIIVAWLVIKPNKPAASLIAAHR